MIYLAYGSNMLIARLRDVRRVPSARCLGRTRLPGYVLRFHKSGADGSAKCDLVRSATPEAAAYGVVFSMDDRDRASLDRVEGRGYHTEFMPVNTADSGRLEAFAYVADRDAVDADLLPFDWYVRLVLAGAREHALPTGYIASIAATPSRPDPDSARAAENQAILG